MTAEVLDFLKSTQVIFAIGLVICSAGASIAVAFIGGYNQRKNRHLELIFNEKMKAYNAFMAIATSFIYSIQFTFKPESDSEIKSINFGSEESFKQAKAKIIDFHTAIMTAQLVAPKNIADKLTDCGNAILSLSNTDIDYDNSDDISVLFTSIKKVTDSLFILIELMQKDLMNVK